MRHKQRALFCRGLELGDVVRAAIEMGLPARDAVLTYKSEVARILHLTAKRTGLNQAILDGLPGDVMVRLATTTPQRLRAIYEAGGLAAISAITDTAGKAYAHQTHLKAELLRIARSPERRIEPERLPVVIAHLAPGSVGRPRVRVRATQAE